MKASPPSYAVIHIEISFFKKELFLQRVASLFVLKYSIGRYELEGNTIVMAFSPFHNIEAWAYYKELTIRVPSVVYITY